MSAERNYTRESMTRRSVFFLYSFALSLFLPVGFAHVQMELVADSLEGMERLLTALSKSKSKSKKDDAILHENLTVVRNLFCSVFCHRVLPPSYFGACFDLNCLNSACVYVSMSFLAHAKQLCPSKGFR